jgi:hypothetical protein
MSGPGSSTSAGSVLADEGLITRDVLATKGPVGQWRFYGFHTECRASGTENRISLLGLFSPRY